MKKRKKKKKKAKKKLGHRQRHNKSKQSDFAQALPPTLGPLLYCKLLDPFTLLLALQPTLDAAKTVPSSS